MHSRSQDPPLLVGAAWKVLDVLLEEALAQDGLRPRNNSTHWAIEEKVKKARAHVGQPHSFDAADWMSVMDCYVGTSQLRHSLVHRTARTDPAGALHGIDDKGNALRPLQPTEQDAFGRMALRSASLVLRAAVDKRDRAALRYELSFLTAFHGVTIPTGNWSHPPREIRVPVDPDPSTPGLYILDLPFVQSYVDLQGDIEADLVIRPRDRPGQVLFGRLEDGPGTVISFDPDHPPLWLST